MKGILVISLILLSIALTVDTETTEEIHIEPYGQASVDVALNAGEIVSGWYEVLSGYGRCCINFCLVSPNGDTLLQWEHRAKPYTQEFSFLADIDGVYVMLFNNSFSDVGKRVMYYYKVTETVAGIPLNFFSVIVPSVLVVGLGAALIIILHPRTRIKNT